MTELQLLRGIIIFQFVILPLIDLLHRRLVIKANAKISLASIEHGQKEDPDHVGF